MKKGKRRRETADRKKEKKLCVSVVRILLPQRLAYRQAGTKTQRRNLAVTNH
ncbi:MAG: hypothetical protein ACYCVH_08690 [Ignavibacteriaceae bacterium]